MSHLRGMVVRLKTGSDRNDGTDDQIYIGVVGASGGKEFPLDVADFNDFEEGSDVTYALGTVWDGAAISDPGVKNPKFSGGTDFNSPRRYRIELDEVTQVYVRKGGTRKGNDDDAYRLDEIDVTLYGANPESRAFGTNRDMKFGNEFGLQIWLDEG